MSTSTVVIKRPSSAEKLYEVSKKKEPYYASFLAICMWGLAAIITSANTEMSPNATGISVTITTQDCLIMFLTTWFLARGLSERNHLYVLPWLLMSIWSMYNCQYTSVLKMFKLLQRTHIQTILPWLALSIDGLGLLIRSVLSVRVAQLAMNQWYHKKLEKELLEKM